MQRETDQMLNSNLSKRKMNGQQLPDTTSTSSTKELKKEETTRNEFPSRCTKIWRNSARSRRKLVGTARTKMLCIMSRYLDSSRGWSNVKWRKNASTTGSEWRRKDKETTSCKRSWMKGEKTKGNRRPLTHLSWRVLEKNKKRKRRWIIRGGRRKRRFGGIFWSRMKLRDKNKKHSKRKKD